MFATLIILALVVVSFSAIISKWKQYLLLRDTPISKVQSAAQGEDVFLKGTATPAIEALIAPLSGKPCCWYAVTIETESSNGSINVCQQCSCNPFYLTAETGQVLIQPFYSDAFDIKTVQCWTDEKYSEYVLNDKKNDKGPVLSNKKVSHFKQFRVTENRIDIDESIFAIGYFQTFQDNYPGFFTEKVNGVFLPESLSALVNRDVSEKIQVSPSDFALKNSAIPQFEMVCNEMQKNTSNNIAYKRQFEAIMKENQKQPLHVLYRKPGTKNFILSTRGRTKAVSKKKKDAFIAALIFIALTVSLVIFMLT